MTRLRAWWRRRHPWAVPFTAIAIPVAVAAVIAAPTAEHSTLPPGGPEVVGSETTSSSPALGLEDPTTTTTVTDLTPVTATTMPEPVEQSGGAATLPAPAPTSPAVTPTPAGSTSSIASGPLPVNLGDVWGRLADCESGGDPSANTGNGYYGAFQFSAETWWAVGEFGYASQFSYEHQRAAAERLQASSGWGQWPACARRLGLL